MKFQNPGMHHSKLILCIKKVCNVKMPKMTRGQNPSMHSSEVMLCSNGQTDAQTNARTNVPEAICTSNFFEVGGINIRDTISQFHWVGNVNRYVHAKQITFYKRFKSYRNIH